MRRFQEQAVEPMQAFCNEINRRNTEKPQNAGSRILWFQIPVAPYIISGTLAGAGIDVGGFLINKRENDNT